MDLIKSVEIGYFRSIYKEKIDRLTGATILFGRNDSGKSNVLRALNLFFYGETNPGLLFSFERDICHARLAEAEEKADARKFVSVKIEFNTPSNWQRSLGDGFYVKKTWSVTRQTDPNVDSSIRDERTRQYLTRFLNKVKFHYVPAIKDRKIFEKLLADVYSVISNQDEFRRSLGDFATELRNRTESLSGGVLASLKMDSAIVPPDDLSDLFRSLDFETKTSSGDSYSLTLQRGDGVQVRHIPAILAFLSDHGAEDYHVWGFEEPENSLEIANAIEEAKIFCKYAEEKNKQLFVTSHSPAFYSLDGPSVSRFFVSKRPMSGVGKDVSNIVKIRGGVGEEPPGDLMGETPHLPIISHYLAEADARIRKLNECQLQLERALKQHDEPILFVEGESDKIVVEAAWRRFFGENAIFRVESCSGTTKMEALSANGSALRSLSENRDIYVLVDNDRAGRDLNPDGHLRPGGKWKKHNSNGTYWCRLPFTDEFAREMKGLRIAEKHWPGSLENCFCREVRERAIADGAYVVTDEIQDDLTIDRGYFARLIRIFSGADSDKVYVADPDPEVKIHFAQWVAEKMEADEEIISWLRPVLEGLRELIESDGEGSSELIPTDAPR